MLSPAFVAFSLLSGRPHPSCFLTRTTSGPSPSHLLVEWLGIFPHVRDNNPTTTRRKFRLQATNQLGANSFPSMRPRHNQFAQIRTKTQIVAARRIQECRPVPQRRKQRPALPHQDGSERSRTVRWPVRLPEPRFRLHASCTRVSGRSFGVACLIMVPEGAPRRQGWHIATGWHSTPLTSLYRENAKERKRERNREDKASVMGRSSHQRVDTFCVLSRFRPFVLSRFPLRGYFFVRFPESEKWLTA